jgi:hypothetical protein
MRYKVAPDPPADIDGLARAQRAVPRVPGSEDDCCTRLQDRLDLATRDDGREWLTFLDALGLATETERGYRRTGRSPTEDTAAVAGDFRDRVFGAAELLDALDAVDDGTLTVADGFADLRAVVPTWERNRHDDWERVWRERTRRLLDWAVLLGLATHDGDAYCPV